MAYTKKRSKEDEKGEPVNQVALNERSNTLQVWLCVAAIAIVTFFVFSPSLNNGFTNWDDEAYVKDNPLVATNSVPLAKLFETPVSDNYHPLTVLSLALNYQNGKLDPFGYHLENLIFHLLNTLLVFLFIFLLTRRNLLMAVIVSLFFDIHPMHVESVAWISERKDVLYVFFFLSGLITYLRYSETKKTSWYIFTLLLFILSCLSKGMAVVFPVILLLIDYLKDIRRRTDSPFGEWERRLLTEKIPFFILSILFGIIAIKAQSNEAIAGINTFTGFQRVMFASYDAILYIVKCFVPFKLSAYYPYPSVVDPDGIPIIFYFSPFILIGILGALIYFFLKKEKELVFGLLFYFVSVALVLQLVSVGSAIMADRYSYLSYIGLLFIVAHLINKAWKSTSGTWASMKYPFMIIAVAGAVVFSYEAYYRTQVWKNSELLWTNVIDNYPNTSIAYIGRGKYYHVNNEAEKAMSDYNTALQLPPSDVTSLKSAYYNRGMLYSAFYNRNDLAVADYTKAIELDSTYADAYNNRGLIYLNAGETGLAISDLNKAFALDHAFNAKNYFNHALLYSKEGKNDSAIADYTEAIKINPAFADAYTSRGLLYGETGNNDLAIDDLNKAIAIDAAFKKAYFNRALFYSVTGKIDLAIADYTRAIEIDPVYIDAYINRGNIYRAYNKGDLAIADYNKAIEFDSSAADAYNDRGGLYLNSGKKDLALADFNKAIAHNPNSAICYYNRGICYRELNDYEKALNDFTSAIRLNPQQVDLYYNMRGMCNSSLQNFNGAIADFSKAIELNPSVAKYWLNRSLAEHKTGQSELAKADALKAKQLQKK